MPRSGRWSSIFWSLAHHFDGTWHGLWLGSRSQHISATFSDLCFSLHGKVQGDCLQVACWRWAAEVSRCLQSLHYFGYHCDTTWDRKCIKLVWPILTKKVKTQRIQVSTGPTRRGISHGLCHHRSNGRAHPWACMHRIDLSGLACHGSLLWHFRWRVTTV